MAGELLFHHARPLAEVEFPPVGRSAGDPSRDKAGDPFLPAYRWLAERVGFWPTFLAVGPGDAARRMTGYQDQWRRVLAVGPGGRQYGKAGEAPNLVLFSWCLRPPQSVFLDFMNWHLVLNSAQPPITGAGRPVCAVTPREEGSVLRPSWSPSRWLQAARRETHAVQAVVPQLDLDSADAVWCRNQASRRALIGLGFDPSRVVVRPLGVDPF